MDKSGADIPHQTDRTTGEDIADQQRLESRVEGSDGGFVARQLAFDVDIAPVARRDEGQRCATDQARSHAFALQRA